MTADKHMQIEVRTGISFNKMSFTSLHILRHQQNQEHRPCRIRGMVHIWTREESPSIVLFIVVIVHMEFRGQNLNEGLRKQVLSQNFR